MIFFIIFVPYSSIFTSISTDYKINFWQKYVSHSFWYLPIDSNHQFSSSLTSSFNEFILTSKLPPAFLSKEIFSLSRSSHRRCSVRKGVLRNFAKFTRKHLCQSLFSNKIAGLRPATLFKKRDSGTGVFL